MFSRPCLGSSIYPPGHTLVANGSRCLACRRAKDRQREQGRPSPTQRGYGTAWTKLAAQIKAAWVAEHGYTCPGFEMPAHPVTPGPYALTVDHVVPKSQGGSDDPTNLAVLCKPCQGRKGRRETPGRRQSP